MKRNNSIKNTGEYNMTNTAHLQNQTIRETSNLLNTSTTMTVKLKRYLITVGILATVVYIMALTVSEDLYGIVQFVPLAAALGVIFSTDKNYKEIGWKWGKTKYQLLSDILPAIMILSIYGIIWATGLGGYGDEEYLQMVRDDSGFDLSATQVLLVTTLLNLTIGIPLLAIFAIGEEIGWRGLMVPEMYKTYGYTKTSLFSGIIWAVFHWPLVIFALQTDVDTPLAYRLLMVTIQAIALGFIFTWLRMKSGSVWTAVIFHTSLNLMTQGIVDQFTYDTGPTEYLIGEMGLFPAIAYGIVALVVWFKRDLLNQTTS